jgi:hypothetical protein
MKYAATPFLWNTLAQHIDGTQKLLMSNLLIIIIFVICELLIETKHC